MGVVNGVVIWDFDGTLAWRPGLWSACVLEVLDEHVPGHIGTLDRIRADLKDGFPWHRAAESHLQLCEADAWWAALDTLLGRVFAGAGVAETQHAALAQAFRARFIDGTVGWQLFADTRQALRATGDPERSWMVGDNPVADVEGAQALGIPAVLIRTTGGEPDAIAAAQLVTSA